MQRAASTATKSHRSRMLLFPGENGNETKKMMAVSDGIKILRHCCKNRDFLLMQLELKLGSGELKIP